MSGYARTQYESTTTPSLSARPRLALVQPPPSICVNPGCDKHILGLERIVRCLAEEVDRLWRERDQKGAA
jgi:hypothetical protein